MRGQRTVQRQVSKYSASNRLVILQEEQSECPDLPIFAGSQPLHEVPRLGSCIVSILIDTADDECNLIAVDEAVVFLVDCSVGEVNQESKSKKCSSYGQKSEYEENPSPSFQSTFTSLCYVISRVIFIVNGFGCTHQLL